MQPEHHVKEETNFGNIIIIGWLSSWRGSRLLVAEEKKQESNLAQPGDTSWGSHYITIFWLISMWISVLEELQNVHDDGDSNDNRGIVASLIEKMENY